MKTTIILLTLFLAWRASCIAQDIPWTAKRAHAVLLASNDITVISSDFLLKHRSDHLASSLISATGHVADAFQYWVSTNQNLKVTVGISTFDTCEHLVAALNEWRKTSNMSPPPRPVTVADLGGRNYYIQTFVGPLQPTVETNSKPYRQDVEPKVSKMIQQKLNKMLRKADDTNVFRNSTAGFELSKPPKWVFVTAQQNFDNLAKTKINNTEFQKAMLRYASAPMVALSKYSEPYDDLNPSFKVNIKPLGKFKGENPNSISTLLVSQMKPMFKDFELIIPPTNLLVSGLTGSYVRIYYTLETQSGQRFPTASELWIVPHGDFFFMMGSGTRQDEKTGKRSEIQEIIKSIKIER